MPESSILYSPAPYHIISYGTLLGSEIFNSFVAGLTAYRVLPRAQFSTLQSNLIPIYFSMQTALPVVLALTFPGERNAVGTHASSISGVLDPQNRLHVLTPIATMFITGLVNLGYIGRRTAQVMKERKHQETRDGKKSYEAPPHSKEMQALNKSFARLHGASTLINMSHILILIFFFITGGSVVLYALASSESLLRSNAVDATIQ